MSTGIYRSFACTAFILILPAHSFAAAEDDNLPIQQIGADDLISVLVYGAPELTRPLRVSPEGTIRLPLVTEPIRVSGLLPSELEGVIAQRLVRENLFVSPDVTVTVAEYRSRTITVAGAVKKPLTFQQTGSIRLMDALVRAEGLIAEAGPTILVISGGGGQGHAQKHVRQIPVKQLFNGDSDANVDLTSGDEVRVPVAEKVFVLGNVRRPGAIRFEDSEQMTLRRVLAVSEGVLPYAGRTAYLYRKHGDKPQEIPVALADILNRKAVDVQMQPGDVLYIPDNKGRRLTMSTLERIVSFGTGTTSGMLIWHR